MITRLLILLFATLKPVVAIVAFLAVLEEASAGTPNGEGPSVNGTWQLADPQTDEKERLSAIERVMEKIPRLARSQASDALLNATKPATKLTVEDRGERLLLAEQKQQFNLVLGAKPIEVDIEGAKVQLSCERKNQLLVVTANSSKAKRTTVYRPSSDGKTLVLDVTLEIPRFQATTRYKTIYALP